MTAEQLAMVSGVVLSLGFSYIPKFKDWFNSFDGNVKRLVTLAVLFVTALGVFGLSCTGKFDYGIACDLDGAIGLVEVLVITTIANQATYQLTPKE